VYPPPGYYGGIIVQLEFRRARSVITHHPWSYGIPSTNEVAEKLAKYRISQVLTYRTQGFDLWDGEMGQHDPKDGGGKTYELEKSYVVKIINLSIANSMGFSWWLYSKNHWKEGSADDIIGASDYALSPKEEKE
jgi:hypothetical protein